ncbi:MAG: hypothetical protein K9N51_07210 [Candidatus Pacebacteria bacterium]|nr:hypothetical protein [Candidatus Paceibacterota bacterium]
MRRYGIQHLINSLFVSVLVGVLCSCGDDIEAMRRQAEIGIEASLSKARESLRYGNYPETLATLQKLQGNAYLTELHKKRINRLMDAAVDAIIEQELEKGPDLPPELPNP